MILVFRLVLCLLHVAHTFFLFLPLSLTCCSNTFQWREAWISIEERKESEVKKRLVVKTWTSEEYSGKPVFVCLFEFDLWFYVLEIFVSNIRTKKYRKKKVLRQRRQRKKQMRIEKVWQFFFVEKKRSFVLQNMMI